MQKRRLYLLLISIVVLVVLLVAVFRREREPEYGGKRLSVWLESYETGLFAVPSGSMQTNLAAKAVREIGPNAVPYLLDWIRWNRSGLQIKLESRMNPILQKLHFSRRLRLKPERRHFWAIFGFQILGPEAKGAISELSRLLNQPTRCESGSAAGAVLPYLGKDALPPLLAALTNQQRVVRERVAGNMEHLGTNARPALPVLIQCLRDRDGYVAWYAPRILIACNFEPEVLLPIVTNCLHDSNRTIRIDFTDALATWGKQSRPALPVLLEIVQDEDVEVAAHATRALGSLGPADRVLSALTRCLADSRVEVRRAAVNALSEFGKEARSAVPYLLKAVNDPDSEVRQGATVALFNIDPKAQERAAR